MIYYPKNSIFIATHSKTASQNPITYAHSLLMAAFVIDPDDGKILDIEVNTVCQVTNDFIKQLVLGLSLETEMEQITHAMESRYFGDSTKAFLYLFKETRRKLGAIKDNAKAQGVKKEE